MNIKITVGFPEPRWKDYKKIRIQALKEVPQAYLDDVDWSENQSDEFWMQRSKTVAFAEVGKLRMAVGVDGMYYDEILMQMCL